MNGFKCNRCGALILFDNFYTVKDDKVYCGICTSELIKEEMRKTGKIELYLNTYDDDWYISDWLGNLRFPIIKKQIIINKIGRYRRIYKVLFKLEDDWWFGIQKGNLSNICQCRRITNDKNSSTTSV